LARIVGLIVGVIVLVVAAIVGGIVLAVMIGLALMAWLVIYVRFRWLARNAGAGKDGEHIVEAEYRVIETTDGDDEAQ
jgi:hypothetical protein